MGDSRELMREQVDYYRARAAEYDETSYGERTGERAAVLPIVDRLAPRGDVLEIACGTGIWTVELARWATTLTAVDAAPEMLQRAARRLAGHDVTFVEADILDWTPTTTYDVVFFTAWLSHVPADLFDTFWDKLAAALKPGGRALFVDESPTRAGLEPALDGEVAARTLSDGSEHRLVKVFYDPDDLTRRLDALGWRATVTPIEHGWYAGEAIRPA